MVRIYTGIKDRTRKMMFSNQEVSFLAEGIQSAGGKILSLEFSSLPFYDLFLERICILYEDNGNYDRIMEFLKDKEDNTKNWANDKLSLGL